MAKLLVVESSGILRGVFKDLLSKNTDFDFDLVATYNEAKELLQTNSYEFAVVERKLEDSPKGEIIALLNKYDIAPLVFTQEIDEVFFESFESAQIVDYIVKQKYNNITYVVEKLKQLLENKNRTVLVISNSHTYNNYLKRNLCLHSFNVLSAINNEEASVIIDKYPELALIILDKQEDHFQSIELIQNIRQRRSKEELKIVALEDKLSTYYTSSLLNNGADDFIIKPFSRDEFYIRIYQNIQIKSLD